MKPQNTPTLTSRERLVIQLHYGQGWTFTEIAEGVGVSKGAILHTHVRAIKKLSSCISKENEGDWVRILPLYL